MRNLAVLVALNLLWSVASVEANRVFTSGFELQSTTNGVEWFTGDTPPTEGAISTSVYRSGAASLRVTSPSSGTSKGQVLRFVGSATNGVDYFWRAYVRIAALPNATTTIMGFSDAATITRVMVMLTASGTLNLQNYTNSPLEGSTVLSTDTWYRLEVRYKRDGTSPNNGADEMELKIDGVTELSSTTESMPVLCTRTAVGINLRGGSDTATSGDLYFDDIALNDSSGSSQTSWPGAGSVVALFPNGAGEFAQTVTLAGSTPAATAWESIDDGTATGTVDAVDYVTFTASASSWTGSGSRIALAMTNLPEYAESVAFVALGTRVANFNTLSSSYILSAQTANGGPRSTDTSAISFADTTLWYLNSDSSTLRATHYFIRYTDPSSAAWTTSSVNNLQALFRGSDVSPNFHLTALWATVEYLPGEEPEPPSDTGGLLMRRVQ